MRKTNVQARGEDQVLPGFRSRSATVRPSRPVQADAGFPHYFEVVGAGVDLCRYCGAGRFVQGGKWMYDFLDGTRSPRIGVCQAELLFGSVVESRSQQAGVWESGSLVLPGQSLMNETSEPQR